MGSDALENSTMDNDYILNMVKRKITDKLLPVTVILYLMVITGIIGNIIAISFYTRSTKCTPPTFLIKCLAVADLGTCFAAIPIISEMMINLSYSLTILCKITHFFGLWTGACACYILWLISIDRYRKICSPLAKQMSLSTVKYLVAGVTAFSLLLAGRLLITFNSVEVEIKDEDLNETAIAQYCATDEDYNLISLLFYSIDFLMILMIWFTVIVTYSRIIYTLVIRGHSMIKTQRSTQSSRYIERASTKQRLSKSWKSFRKGFYPSRRNRNIEETDDVSSSDVKTDDTDIYTIGKCNEYKTDQQCRSSQKQNFDFTSAKRPSEVKLTLMMFTVSMIFILCFTPYFAIRIFIRIVLKSGREYDFSAWIQFALKLPYINSAFNPLIYFCFNPNLRRYVCACFSKCCFKSKKKVMIQSIEK